MFKRIGNSKIYRNFVISYIITLLIPLLIMTIFVLYNFVNTLKHEVEINLTNSFKKSVDHFELQIEQLQETSLQIELNNTFKNINLKEQPYNAINIKDELQKYSTSSFADKILIYHYDEDYILSTDYLYSLEDFLKMYVLNSNNNFNLPEFKTSEKKDGIFFFSETDLTLGSQKNLMYLHKIPVNSSKDYAVVMYLISEASLKRVLNPSIVTNDSYVFVKDSVSNQIIFSFSEDSDKEKIDEIMKGLQNITESSTQKIKANKNQFSVFTLKPKNLDIEFIQVVPSDLLENKINKIRTIFIISMIVIIVLSGFIIPILIRINYRPIKNLKKRIEDTLPTKYSIKDNLNEIEALEYAFLQYNKENEELEELAQNYNGVFQQYLLDCFILGQAKEIENILETCQSSGLIFDKKYYCTIILKVSKAEYEHKIQHIEKVLNPQYEQENLQFFIKSDISLKKIVLILGVNEDSEETSKECTMNLIKHFKEQYNEDIRIGMGSYVKNIFDIYLSYQQALKVLDYNYTVSNSSITNISELPQATEVDIKYPFKLFMELEGAIQQRDALKIEEVIKELLLFIKTENLTLYWAKNICFDIVNTIFKQILMLDRYSSLLSKPYIERIYGSEIAAYDDIEEIMMEIIDDLANYMDVGEGTYELELLQKIIRYIRENYMDLDFSLQSLADSIQMSPPYLSQYFKKNTNYTISEYVARLRMEKAKELLLQTDMNVHDIASQVGYYSASSFIRKFKELENITPGQYKKKYS